MGVYESTPLEPILQIHIFESGAKNVEQMSMKMDWMKNIPTFYGKLGFNEVTAVISHVVVQKKGSMDEDLF